MMFFLVAGLLIITEVRDRIRYQISCFNHYSKFIQHKIKEEFVASNDIIQELSYFYI
jgi:glutaredoxin-related protein